MVESITPSRLVIRALERIDKAFMLDRRKVLSLVWSRRW
jgi:hypothetical protein